ncbi:MAG: hypothetical protein ACR2PL_05290 [Dehalococcoidia bacterium]
MSMQLHRKAESFMGQAEKLEREGRFEEARRLFQMAAEEEAAAFEHIPRERQKTRGIIAISVVSLRWRGGDLDLAIRDAYRYLSLPDLPAAAVEELEDLISEIRRARQARTLGQSYSGRALEISLRGEAFRYGLAPLDILLLKFEQTRKLLTRTAEWIAQRPFRLQGSVSDEVNQMFSPLVGAATPGSYQFQLRIQTPLQPVLFSLEGTSSIRADDVADAFFSVLQVTAGVQQEQLNERLPDRLYRDTFLKLVRNLATGGKGLEEIEIADRSRADLLPVVLNAAVSREIDRSIPKHTRTTEEEPEPVGTLRALHLDKNWLVLVERGREQEYHLAEGKVLDDVVGPFVNRRVRLVGSGRRDRYLVDDILLAEMD